MLKEIKFSLPLSILSDINDFRQQILSEMTVESDMQRCVCVNKTWKCVLEDSQTCCTLAITKVTKSDEIIFSFQDLSTCQECDCLDVKVRTVEVCRENVYTVTGGGKRKCEMCGHIISDKYSCNTVKSNEPSTNRRQIPQNLCNERQDENDTTCTTISADKLPSDTTCTTISADKLPPDTTCTTISADKLPSDTTCTTISADKLPSDTTCTTISADKLPSDTLIKSEPDSCDDSPGLNCRRMPYSLRGVKISQKIMKAEKLGLNKKINTNSSNPTGPHKFKSDSKLCTKISPQRNGSEEIRIGWSSDSEDVSKERNLGNDHDGINDSNVDCENAEGMDNNKVNTENDLPMDVSEDNDDREYIPRVNMKRKHKRVNLEYSTGEKERRGKRVQGKIQKKTTQNVKNELERMHEKICKYCSKKFVNYSRLENHVKKYHKDKEDVEEYLVQIKSCKELSCVKCGSEFTEDSSLREHIESVHKASEKDTTCFKCNRDFHNRRSLRRHIRYVHNNRQSELCHLCPAKFKSKSSLRHHILEIHDKKLDVQCEICGQKFSRKNLLNRHMVSHGVDKSRWLECSECGKGFWFPFNLKRHMQAVHGPQGDKQHCSYCGRGFSSKAGMVSHVQQVHFNMFPFHCPVEECKAGFGRKKAVDEHMKQVHPNVDYVSLKTTRKRYKYWKSTEELFYCSHCSSSFCYKAKLVEHMHNAHSDAFPYKCDICNQGFLEYSFLMYHQKKAHNKDIGSTDTNGDVNKSSSNQDPDPVKDTSGNDSFREKLKALLEGNDLTTGNAESKANGVSTTEDNEEITSSQDVPNNDGSQVLIQNNTVELVEPLDSEDLPEGSTVHYIIEDVGDGTVLIKELINQS